MTKKYIISAGFYKVYNINVEVSSAEQAEVEIHAYLEENGLQALLDRGQPLTALTGQDVLIRCEGELQKRPFKIAA